MENMSSERFRQIRKVFEAVVEQAPDARQEFLDAACGGDDPLREQVLRLLAAHGAGLPWLAHSASESLSTDPRRIEGRRIGNYRVLREIGSGGMGVVYLAARADHAFHKLVAIKVVHSSLVSAELMARFEQEREILATLDHPNIARLLDGGTTPDGLSYLVMEYVEGSQIGAYCDEHKLDIEARLILFRTVCAAVDYAHHRGVVHRDLKPANILVTKDGTVKLVDFGIAKLVRDPNSQTTGLMTRTGLRLMTPEFASPEQVKGDPVGAGTDIYALGVVLYELLTGSLPYRLHSRVFHEIVRVICEEPPIRPSAALSQGERDTAEITRVRRTTTTDLRRRLSGDLDGIILKAMEKEAYDRYRSAASFSNDIERHLQGLPVEARQATPVYRSAKFIRRNLPWIVLLGGLASAFALGGITVHMAGAVVIVACVLVLALWYLGTNQEVGRRVAKSEFLFTYLPQRFALLSPFVSYWIREKPIAIIFAALLPVLLRQTIGWMGRRRTGGSLVVDLSPQDSIYNIQRYVSLLLLGLVSYGLIRHKLDPIYVPGMVSCVLASFLVYRLEIRTRGIVYAGSLYVWERIESYEWRSDPQKRRVELTTLGLSKSTAPPKDMLKLTLRRTVKFLPPVRIPIPPGRRPEVEAILSRYLSEWPNDVRPAAN
jgi:serine/threonine protein kinase